MLHRVPAAGFCTGFVQVLYRFCIAQHAQCSWRISMLERCGREEIPAKCQIQGACEDAGIPSAGLDSPKFTSPCATYQNISSKIFLGFGCFGFVFKCEMPEAGDFPGKGHSHPSSKLVMFTVEH